MKTFSHYRLVVVSVVLMALLIFTSGATWAAPAPEPEQQAGTVCTVVTDSLNLRTGPSTRYRIIRGLPWGTELQVLGDAPSAVNPVYRWLNVRVTWTGERGWVSADAQYVQCGWVRPPVADTVGISLGPVQAVYAYYAWINQRRYSDTWRALSPSFRAIKNHNDFGEYQRFWNGVRRVDVLDAWLLDGQPMAYATVQASMRYTNTAGQVSRDPYFVLHLVWDDASAGWVIDETQS